MQRNILQIDQMFKKTTQNSLTKIIKMNASLLLLELFSSLKLTIIVYCINSRKYYAYIL